MKMIDWLKLAWLILPPSVANMMPPIAEKWFPDWKSPVDMGKTLGGIRIFGDHKTVRGFVVGVVCAQILFLILGSRGMPWYFGGLLGFGALAGDAIKSFFKRRALVKSGRPWIPWDQIDWILGFTAIAQIWGVLNLAEFVILILVGVVLHLLFKVIGFALNFNKTLI